MFVRVGQPHLMSFASFAQQLFSQNQLLNSEKVYVIETLVLISNTLSATEQSQFLQNFLQPLVLEWKGMAPFVVDTPTFLKFIGLVDGAILPATEPAKVNPLPIFFIYLFHFFFVD